MGPVRDARIRRDAIAVKLLRRIAKKKRNARIGLLETITRGQEILEDLQMEALVDLALGQVVMGDPGIEDRDDD
jgi:hypothetical protein